MPVTVKEMMEAANAVVERIDAAKAKAMTEQGALLLDIRDANELENTGRAVGAHHIPRGMLEFRADDALQSHDPELRKDRPIVLYCASGGARGIGRKTPEGYGIPEGVQSWWIDGLGEWGR